MHRNDEHDKKVVPLFKNKKRDEEEDDEGKGGGKSGKINLRFKTEVLRDDLLSPDEMRRLLLVHADLHKANVDKQKVLRKERADLKSGKKQDHQLGQGLGQGNNSRFKKHPISNKAQFSGIDRQVSNVPTDFRAETNDEARNDLQNRLENRLENKLQLQNQPKREFNPKPRPY
jgi:hypothetical protein